MVLLCAALPVTCPLSIPYSEKQKSVHKALPQRPLQVSHIIPGTS